MEKKDYEIYNEDCIKWMTENKDRQFDLSVFSPPFASLYAYSQHCEDMGNSRDSDNEFMLHHEFFLKALYPIIKEGRNVCVHVQNPARSIVNHGYVGIWDMRGEMIRQYEQAGFHYYGEVTIWKNPQAQSIRTKTQCLAFTQFIKDSSRSRPALADYLLIFKKGVKSEVPCTSDKQKNEHGAMERKDVTNQNWIDWASPIWYTDEQESTYLPYQTIWKDINETKTLNQRTVRTEKDEKHLCPLQLDLIERCIKLWSNPGETVFSPFGGIGSESYMSLKLGRKSCTTELKEVYANQIDVNCKKALQELEDDNAQTDLFGGK